MHAEHVERMGEKFLVGKTGKKRTLKDIHYMVNNTKTDRMEIRREGVDGIYLAQIMTAGFLL
jgi:hypothetical protein